MLTPSYSLHYLRSPYPLSALCCGAHYTVYWKDILGRKNLSRWRVKEAHLPQRRWLEVLRSYQAAEYHARKARIQDSTSGHAHINVRTGASSLAAERAVNWRAKLDEVAVLRRNRGMDHPLLRWVPRTSRPWFTFREPPATDGRWEVPYPDEEYLMPTKVGNALRKMETYGVRQYGLDSSLVVRCVGS